MKIKNAVIALPVFLGLLGCSAAQAQTASPTARFTIGAKAWHAEWLSYMPSVYSGINPDGSPALADSVNAVEGTSRTSILPQLGVSYGKFFASVNHGEFKSDFRVNASSVLTPAGQNLITSRTDHFKRRESDITIGYAVTPEIGLAIGYKDATETRETSLGIAPGRVPFVETKAKGVILGAVGSFAVHDKLRLYVQAGYGPARLKLRFADPAMASSKTDGSYVIGEIGLSYPIFSNANGAGLNAALGYRTQTVKTDGYADTAQQSRDLRDVREGLVLALNFVL